MRANQITGNNFIKPINMTEFKKRCEAADKQSFCSWLLGYNINYNGGKRTRKQCKSKSARK